MTYVRHRALSLRLEKQRRNAIGKGIDNLKEFFNCHPYKVNFDKEKQCHSRQCLFHTY